jgi:hypothetical protein
VKAVTDHLTKAEAAWGAELPDWVRALAIACGRTSQAAVGRELDRSGAIVNQVLHRKYLADTTRIEERVRGIYLNGRVLCPALGELPSQHCQDWRDKSRAFTPGNPLRTRMFRACRGCVLNVKEAET